MSKQRFINSVGTTEEKADRFIEAYLGFIKNHYETVWQTPVKGTLSEEYASLALNKAGIDTVWDGYDHASGTDLTMGDSRVSMKSSTQKNKTAPTRSDISGSRLTSYDTKEEMLEALGKQDYNDMFMINRRLRKDVQWDKKILRGEDYREINLVWLPGDFVKPNDYNWVDGENKNGKKLYYATDFDKGLNLEIVPSMSCQYWISGIDFEEYLEPHVIGTVRIQRSESEGGMVQYENGMHLTEISNPDSKQVQKEAKKLGWNLKSE